MSHRQIRSLIYGVLFIACAWERSRWAAIGAGAFFTIMDFVEATETSET